MSTLAFRKNENMGLGVEIEIQLIDPTSGDLKPVAPQILEKLKGDEKAKHIKTEIFQSMIEIETPICENAQEVGQSLRRSLRLAREMAGENGARIIMAGTHPFADYSERLLTPKGRYFQLVDRNQWITRRLQIFGLHVHIGMRDGDHAIDMNNALCHYLPMILAISASSPFWHKEDTGLASSRITFFEAIPTGGHPYLLNNWAQFEELIDRLTFSKSITSLKDLWWDIRPNLEFGTIEVRIADCPPTIREVEALVALLHGLALFIDAELKAGRKFSPPPEWILRENKWRASRHGVQADLIKDAKGTSVPFLELWKEMRASTGEIWQKLGYEEHLSFIESVIAKGPSYQRQRQAFENGFQGIIRHLVKENESDMPDWG